MINIVITINNDWKIYNYYQGIYKLKLLNYSKIISELIKLFISSKIKSKYFMWTIYFYLQNYYRVYTSILNIII